MIVCWTDMPRPEVLILGNSHAAARVAGAARLGVNLAGGKIARARELNRDCADFDGADFTFRHAEADARYRRFLAAAGAPRAAAISCPVVCNFGTNLPYLARRPHWEGVRFISQSALEALHAHLNEGALDFVRQLTGLGLKVYLPIGPRRCAAAGARSLFLRLEPILAAQAAQAGAEVVDISELTADEQDLLPDYRQPDDEAHGNGLFGELMLQAILARSTPDAGSASPRTS